MSVDGEREFDVFFLINYGGLLRNSHLLCKLMSPLSSADPNKFS